MDFRVTLEGKKCQREIHRQEYRGIFSRCSHAVQTGVHLDRFLGIRINVLAKREGGFGRCRGERRGQNYRSIFNDPQCDLSILQRRMRGINKHRISQIRDCPADCNLAGQMWR